MRSFQIHFSQSQNHFLLAFSSYAILFFLFEYFLGQPLSQSYKLVLFESLFFALLGYMMNFSTAFLKSWTVLFLLYESPILVLSQNPQSTLFPRDAVLASGLVLFWLWRKSSFGMSCRAYILQENNHLHFQILIHIRNCFSLAHIGLSFDQRWEGTFFRYYADTLSNK